MHTDMQRRGFLAFALLCLGGRRAFAAPQATDDLIGIWSAQVRTKGGLGAQMTFTAAGDITSTFGALIDLKYEIDQDKFKMTIAGPDERPMSTLIGREFKIDGDQLTINQGDLGPPQVMTRVGMPHRDAHPIVGDWSFTHSTGATAVQRFSRKGTAQLSVVAKLEAPIASRTA